MKWGMRQQPKGKGQARGGICPQRIFEGVSVEGGKTLSYMVSSARFRHSCLMDSPMHGATFFPGMSNGNCLRCGTFNAWSNLPYHHSAPVDSANGS